MNYKEIVNNDFFVNPTLTSYGTLPRFLERFTKSIKVKPYAGERPNWLPSTDCIRKYLMKNYWGGNYKSRSLMWVIGHNGSPLSADSIQIDHIIEWETIRKKLLYQYNGKNANGTPFAHLNSLPHSDGKLIKGIDYIDHPEISKAYGPDVLYCFTNIAAIKYFHTIENLRPLPGSINSRRNNSQLMDEDLSIINPQYINYDLMKKLAELSASVEEYTSQIVHQVQTYDEIHEREIFVEQSIERVNELISYIDDVNRTDFF